MRIGYARVSTEDQKLDLQREALRKAGCARVYQEKRSGAGDRRPALDRALAALKAGDVLVVWKLDRLGRSLQHLISILDDLNRRGVGFCSLSDGIDTTTPAGKLLFHVTGAVAEFERSLISERTKAGMAVSTKQGRKPGRPRRLDDMQARRVAAMAVVEGRPLDAIAREMAVSKSTVQRAVAAFRAQVRARAEDRDGAAWQRFPDPKIRGRRRRRPCFSVNPLGGQ